MELIAVALICASTVLSADCDRVSALEVLAMPTPSPLTCALHAQAMVAGSPLAEHLGDDAYLKLSCERRSMTATAR